MRVCAHVQFLKNIESLLWEKNLEPILTRKAGLTYNAFPTVLEFSPLVGPGTVAYTRMSCLHGCHRLGFKLEKASPTFLILTGWPSCYSAGPLGSYLHVSCFFALQGYLFCTDGIHLCWSALFSREVPLKDAKEYAESIGAVVVETSAKNAINIEELFQGISK